MAAVLGGAQSLHTNGRDEALALPTEESARLALRTQQIIAYETGVVNTADPLGGSEVIERMTDKIERAAEETIQQIDAMGGTLRAIETGWIQNQIQNAAYEYQVKIEAGEQVVVGVNRFRTQGWVGIPTFRLDPELERAQVERLREVRANRSAEACCTALRRLTEAASSEENLMPRIVTAAEAWATVGEISSAMRTVFGEYSD
jgi:methylmalonyl-CoA mutase N-terminal domain/subunit